MQLRDISFQSPAENILYDEVLLQLADKHSAGEFLRFWESPEIFVVMGLIGKEHEDVNLDVIKKEGIKLLRRTSGGGTVLQGPGSLNFTLVLNKDRHPDLQDLRLSYSWISAKVIETFKVMGVDAVFKPISDIALAKNNKKISGNAQHRGKNYILHHGTILYQYNLDLVPRYLRMPKEMPEYRQNRSHLDFISNVNINVADFKRIVCSLFDLDPTFNIQNIDSKELSALKELLQKRQVIVEF